MLAAGLMLVGVVALGHRRTVGLGALSLAIAALGWTHIFTDEYTAGVARMAHLASGALFCSCWVILGIALYRGKRAKF
jgi:hypothetical protein